MVLVRERAALYRIGMNKLRGLREKAGLSQEELAKQVDSHQPRIVDWEKEPHESGYRRIPLDTARKMVVILDCMLTDLRPDLLNVRSIDVLLEGAPTAIQDDIRNYAIYRLGQRG
jgi:DNA-binding XRE family transcriptional regulator